MKDIAIIGSPTPELAALATLIVIDGKAARVTIVNGGSPILQIIEIRPVDVIPMIPTALSNTPKLEDMIIKSASSKPTYNRGVIPNKFKHNNKYRSTNKQTYRRKH